MDKLNLPEIREALPPARTLSMDEYLEFVAFNLKQTFDRQAHDKMKSMCAVNVPFVLEDD